jgi:phage terminase large subunit GpA-like protein
MPSTATHNSPPVVDADLLAALSPPARVSAVDWPELHRDLTGHSSRPGPFRWSHAPYLRGLAKLASAPGVIELNLQKSTQGGGSELARALLGWWADQQPDPAGIMLPNEKKGRQIIENEIIPMFENTPVLRDLFTARARDIKSGELKLINGFILYLMWAGSSASSSANPMRRTICDEVNKFNWRGVDAHPVDLAASRLTTYGDDAFQFNISSPTTPLGMITQIFESSDYQLYPLIECPGCATRIRLIFDAVKWKHYKGKKRAKTNAQWARRIIDEEAAWYECQNCGATISEQHRRRLVQHVTWGTTDEHGIADGEIVDAESIERWPRGTRLGVQFSALYYLDQSLEMIAAKWIRAIGSLTKRYLFITNVLGEAFRERVASTSPDLYSEKSTPPRSPLPEGLVPSWSAGLIATIDTQQDGFYLVIRAWGPQMLSHRVFHRWCESFQELDKWLWNHPWPYEDSGLGVAGCDLALIDSGGTRAEGAAASRTMDVYRWVLERQPRVRAIKGDNRPREGLFIRRGTGWLKSHDRRTRGQEVSIWLLDVHHFQDELAEMIKREVRVLDSAGEEHSIEQWTLSQSDDETYNAHMANLEKTAAPAKAKDGASRELIEEWSPRRAGARVDYRHCEGYQIAAAYMLGVHTLPDLKTFIEARDAALAHRAVKQQQEGGHASDRRPSGVTMPDGRPFIITQR